MPQPEFIKVGCLLLTPQQYKRAMDNDMTISETLAMVKADNARKTKRVAKREGK